MKSLNHYFANSRVSCCNSFRVSCCNSLKDPDASVSPACYPTSAHFYSHFVYWRLSYCRKCHFYCRLSYCRKCHRLRMFRLKRLDCPKGKKRCSYRFKSDWNISVGNSNVNSTKPCFTRSTSLRPVLAGLKNHYNLPWWPRPSIYSGIPRSSRS